jgi:Raf kinase inhibitor-like YbhB/YbcL family protein
VRRLPLRAASQTDGVHRVNVTCPALRAGKFIPTRNAFRGIRGGENVSLPIAWSDPPAETKSFVILIVDRHPIARNWLHWCVFDIPASVLSLQENASKQAGGLPVACKQLRNSYGEPGYGGPQPPKGSGPHEYEITVHALKRDVLDVSPSASLNDVVRALEGNILSSASTTGVFEQ